MQNREAFHMVVPPPSKKENPSFAGGVDMQPFPDLLPTSHPLVEQVRWQVLCGKLN